MKITPLQLDSQLKSAIRPWYWLAGDEPLQLQEAAQRLRDFLRTAGFEERQVFHVDSGWDWGRLSAAIDTLSLFSRRRLIELRLPSGKLLEAGAQALAAYAERPAPDVVLLVISPKIESTEQRKAWYQALDRAGVLVQVWPVDAQRWPQWVEQRLRAAGLRASAEAVSLLAERLEGNLLGCAQEVEKLRLLAEEGAVSADLVMETVAADARFDVYRLVDEALAGDLPRSLRVFDQLRAEGAEPVLIVWAFAKELRALSDMAREMTQGKDLAAAMAAKRVWEQRRRVVGAALRRLREPQIAQLLQQAACCDRAIKTGRSHDAWEMILVLTESVADAALLRRWQELMTQNSSQAYGY